MIYGYLIPPDIRAIVLTEFNIIVKINVTYKLHIQTDQGEERSRETLYNVPQWHNMTITVVIEFLLFSLNIY